MLSDLRAAIFGMRPPADIGEQAGCVAVACLVGGPSLEAEGAKTLRRSRRPVSCAIG